MFIPAAAIAKFLLRRPMNPAYALAVDFAVDIAPAVDIATLLPPRWTLRRYCSLGPQILREFFRLTGLEGAS